MIPPDEILIFTAACLGVFIFAVIAGFVFASCLWAKEFNECERRAAEWERRYNELTDTLLDINSTQPEARTK